MTLQQCSKCLTAGSWGLVRGPDPWPTAHWSGATWFQLWSHNAYGYESIHIYVNDHECLWIFRAHYLDKLNWNWRIKACWTICGIFSVFDDFWKSKSDFLNCVSFSILLHFVSLCPVLALIFKHCWWILLTNINCKKSYCGLNICVPLLPAPEFICWNPNHQCAGFWRWDSERSLGHEGGVFMNGISALIKVNTESSFTPFSSEIEVRSWQSAV